MPETMRKILVIMLAGFILLNAFGNASAQEELPVDEQPQEDECDEDGCGDCTACRDNSFYYILIVGLIIFAVLFYLRNKEKIGQS